MMNSLFFSGAIKGHTDSINLFIWEKKEIFSFFLNSRRDYQNGHRQRQLTVGGWYWLAESHLTLISDHTISLEEQQTNSRGTCVLLLADPVPAGSVSETSRPGRPPCWGGEEEWRSTRSDCLSPLTPAAPPAPECLQTALQMFLLRWFWHLRALVTDTKSWSLLGSVAEEVSKNLIVPYVMKHAFLSTARCGQLGSSWGLQGWCTLIPLCCYGLLTWSTYTVGLPLPAWQRPSHSRSDRLLTFNKSPPQLQSMWTRRA